MQIYELKKYKVSNKFYKFKNCNLNFHTFVKFPLRLKTPYIISNPIHIYIKQITYTLCGTIYFKYLG